MSAPPHCSKVYKCAFVVRACRINRPCVWKWSSVVCVRAYRHHGGFDLQLEWKTAETVHVTCVWCVCWSVVAECCLQQCHPHWTAVAQTLPHCP